MSGLKPFRNVPADLVEWSRWMRDQDDSLSTFIKEKIEASDLCGVGASSTSVGGDGGDCTWEFVYFPDDYSLDSSDAGKFLVSTSATAVNLTIPSGVFEVGEQVSVFQYGAGQVTVVAGSGTTINTPETLLIAEQYGTVALVLEDNDLWFIAGRLESSGGAVAELDDLTDIASSTPANRYALMGNGDTWTARYLYEADILDLQSYLLAAGDEVITGAWQWQADIVYDLDVALQWTSYLGADFDALTVASVQDAAAYDANTLVQIMFNGTDEAAAATDDTGTHTPTFVGNAQLDTAIKKEGTAALLLDGSGDYVEVPSHTDFDFGTADFTVEFWCYPHGFGTQHHIFSWGGSTTGALYTNSGDATLRYQTGGVERKTAGTLTANEWVHLALVRESGTDRIYVNGVQINTDTTGQSFDQGAIGIGRLAPSANVFDGHIDAVRVSDIARYTGGITVTPPINYDISTEVQLGHADYNTVIKGAATSVSGAATLDSTLSVGGAATFDTTAKASKFLQLRLETSTNLADVTHAVNTDAGKVQGAMIWDSTNDKMKVATGSADASTWVDADGTNAVTPA